MTPTDDDAPAEASPTGAPNESYASSQYTSGYYAIWPITTLGELASLGDPIARSAYVPLLLTMWLRGGALANNDAVLGSAALLPVPTWRRVRPMIEPLCIVTAETWRHAHVDAELLRYRQRSERGRRAVIHRWRAR